MIVELLLKFFPGRRARLRRHFEKIYSDAIAKRDACRRAHKKGARKHQRVAETALARIMELSL
jgi:hypothetical protein